MDKLRGFGGRVLLTSLSKADEEKLPFSFINDNGDLVGLDVALMHILAQDLGVKIEIKFTSIQQFFNQMNF